MAMNAQGCGNIHGGCHLEEVWMNADELLEPFFYTKVSDAECQMEQCALLRLMQ